MPTLLEYMKFSLNVYAASLKNQIGVPSGWARHDSAPDLPPGFSAGTFTKGSEVVISYTGTNGGLDYANWFIGAGFGFSQLYEAIDYYFAAKAKYGDNITFTGHSLGAGLASLMAVYFNKQAVVFDEAPFQVAALSPIVTAAVVAYMGLKGYQSDAFTTYVETLGLSGLTRESNVTNYFVQGEVLQGGRAVIPNLAGANYVFSTGNTTADPISLHSMALMLAIQASDTFRDAVTKLPDLVTMLADSNLFGADSNNDQNIQDLLRKLLRHEFSIAGEITADAMLTRLASDINKLAQDGGLTMIDGNAFNANLNYVSKALTAFAMQMYYEDTSTDGSNSTKELFTDLSTANGSYGVKFDIADVSTKIKAAIDAGQQIRLNEAKGFEQYFLKYINDIANFSIEEQKLIQSILPSLRDWYVQAGVNGMNVTDDKNRGAFMLGGVAENDAIYKNGSERKAA
jgi:hypothetical protein